MRVAPPRAPVSSALSSPRPRQPHHSWASPKRLMTSGKSRAQVREAADENMPGQLCTCHSGETDRDKMSTHTPHEHAHYAGGPLAPGHRQGGTLTGLSSHICASCPLTHACLPVDTRDSDKSENLGTQQTRPHFQLGTPALGPNIPPQVISHHGTPQNQGHQAS